MSFLDCVKSHLGFNTNPDRHSASQESSPPPPEPPKSPMVLIDVSPWVDPESDWSRILEVVQRITDRGLICKLSALWPWGDQLNWLRRVSDPALPLELRDFDGDFDHRIATGDEPLPIRTREWWKTPQA